jgi:pimeloyl-ACP methyl ester carboxylesterase
MAIATISRAGVNLSCRATGPADADRSVLLIHGLNTNMAFWHPQLVRRLSADRLLLMYDQRGHGNSDMPERGYRLTDLVDDALAVLDAHGVESTDIVAHSFGTGVALQMARRHPDRVRSVAVLDGRLRSIQQNVRLRDWSSFARWARRIEEAGMSVDPDWEIDCRLPLRMEAVDFSKISAGLEADGFFVPRVNKRSGEKYRRLLTETQALVEYDDADGLTRDVLSELRLPILLIYGTLSPFLPTCDTLTAELPDVRTEILEGGGHNFPLARPAETLAALAQWETLALAAEESCKLAS